MQDSAPWLALYSLHYLGEWKRLGLLEPDALDVRFAPLTLLDSVAMLQRHAGRDAALYRSLAIAALCRGCDSPSIGRDKALEGIGRLADGALQPQDQAVFAGVLALDGAEDRFTTAIELASGLPSMMSSARFCPRSLVSDVKVVAVAAKSASSLAGALDPRLWHSQNPELWEASYTVDALQSLVDRDSDPPPVVRRQGGWHSAFFEKVAWVAPGTSGSIRLGTIRNVLHVKYELNNDGADGAEFTYRAVECLSTDYTFQLSQNQGGIDRDSGLGRIEKLSTPPGSPDLCQITAQKSIRFTQPAGMVYSMNVAACVNTLALLEWLVIAAATQQSPGPAAIQTLSYSVDQNSETTDALKLEIDPATQIGALSTGDLVGQGGAVIPADRVHITTTGANAAVWVSLVDLCVLLSGTEQIPEGTYVGKLMDSHKGLAVANLALRFEHVPCF